MSLWKRKLYVVLFALVILNPAVALAQTNTLPHYKNVDSTLKEYVCTPQGDGQDLPRCINRVYRFGIVAGALALVFFTVWAGYYYIFGGEASKTNAKGMIMNVLVGMALLVGSYALLYFLNPDLTLFKPIQPPIFLADDLPTCSEIGFGNDCVIADGHNLYFDTPGTLGPCKAGFKSDAEARQYMTTIQVDTWDKSGNTKVSKKRSITVQECVAEKFKAAFAAMYASSEKFPIHGELEGYNFRLATGSSSKLSAHGLGLAIDINPNENYYLCTSSSCKVKQVGSFWKPCPQSGCSEYSMPASGSAVTSFKSQGFGWGGEWNSLKDYMHFSCYPGEHAHCF